MFNESCFSFLGRLVLFRVQLRRCAKMCWVPLEVGATWGSETTSPGLVCPVPIAPLRNHTVKVLAFLPFLLTYSGSDRWLVWAAFPLPITDMRICCPPAQTSPYMFSDTAAHRLCPGELLGQPACPLHGPYGTATPSSWDRPFQVLMDNWLILTNFWPKI